MRSRVLAPAILLATLASACDRPSQLRAFQVTSRGELVGGPGAIGEVDDWVLENDQIRLVISNVGNSWGPGLFGGSIIDADLARPQVRFSNARGLDQFSEVFPMTNLVVPGFFEGDPARRNVGLDDMRIEVISDGNDGKEARLRITAKGDSIIEALATVGLAGVIIDLSFQTDLILEPGKRYIRMRTRINVDSARRPQDADGDTEMAAIQESLPLFGALLGDALRPASEREIEQGFLAGDFLLFGPKVHVFAPGDGFEVGLLFQRRFDQGVDVLNDPYMAPYLAASGDHVSYAYFSASGQLSVPIFTSSFTGAFTHLYQCRLDDDECQAGYRQGRIVYERFLAIGDGDIGSALESFYEVRREPHGTLRGHVLDGATGQPLSGAQAFVLRAPEGPSGSALEAIASNRAEVNSAGVVLEMQADAAATARATGSFAGKVPPGDYLLVARAPGRAVSDPLPFSVQDGQTLDLSIAVPAPGRIDLEITNEQGAPSPGKLILLGPGDCDVGSAETPVPLVGTGPAGRSSSQIVALGDEELPDGVAAIHYLGPGRSVVEAPPGTYEAVVSRGVEYSIDRQCITVVPSLATIVKATVAHVVDTTGWISGDFHIHGVYSYDANVSHVARVAGAVGEGLDLICSTDHDYLSDFGPTVAALGLGDYLATMVGLETTTIEVGHYIGFPLRFDELAEENGAIEWSRRDECLIDPAGSRCVYGDDDAVLPLVPDEIFDGLRNLGSLGPERTVINVPHPRDGFFGYFDQFGLNPFDLDVSPGGLSSTNPVLVPELFSANFDSIELFNAKRFELIRTPTVAEIMEFKERLDALRAEEAPTSEIAALHDEFARRVLERTPEENAALGFGSELPEPEGPCTSHADCRVDEKCSPERATCVALRCIEEEAADPELADRPCIHHQGVIDDWFRLLEHGVRYTGLGNSDTHKLHDVEVGTPRNWIASPTDAPREIEHASVAAAVKAGQVTMGYGPFVELWVNGAPIGETVPAGAGGSVRVRVRVQTPEWFGVDRLELYRNGELWIEQPIDVDASEIVDLDETFEDEPDRDSWYVAIALGTEGGLAPVYTSVAHPNLGFSQVAAVAFSGIDSDLIRAIVPPLPPPPEVNAIIPYGITNPVWVDVDGGGFAAPQPRPGWAGGSSNEEPLSRERLESPFGEEQLDDDELRARRLDLVRRSIEDAMQVGR
ncbi:MAG: CehA/McbA family metallohydrolase [Deltaproteobacteria bacterium]|nr:CehA/McbA family metallohydrolase [Deltaproteobacteria bacterium]